MRLKLDKTLVLNLMHLIDQEELEGTPQQRAEARLFYESHYDILREEFELQS